jgi:Ca2+-binding EF-hand superfamily protein
LDPEEIALVPWGAPPPSESDLNGDGTLSEVELAERLKVLAAPPRETRRRGRERNVENPREQGRGSAADGDQAPRTTEPAVRRDRERDRRTTTSDDRVDAYIRDMLKKWDTDGDGRLSAEELSEMRNPPPASADQDGDGQFTYAELYAYYGDGEAPKSSSGSNVETSVPIPGAIRWSGAFEESPADPDQLPAYLARLDRNRDGMVSMAEFATEWDAKTRADFERLDLNGDGYITPQEAHRAESGQGSGSNMRGGTSARTNSTGRGGAAIEQRGAATNRRGENSSSRFGRGGAQRGGGDRVASVQGEQRDQRAESPPNGRALPNAIRYNLGRNESAEGPDR